MQKGIPEKVSVGAQHSRYSVSCHTQLLTGLQAPLEGTTYWVLKRWGKNYHNKNFKNICAVDFLVV